MQTPISKGEGNEDCTINSLIDDDCKDVLGDVREFLTCALVKLLLTPKQSLVFQGHTMLRTHCTIAYKVCELLIDSGCIENIIASTVVKTLQ